MRLLERLRGSGHPPPADLSLSELADLIQNERRRQVIHLLADGPLELRELAEHIAEAEVGPDPSRTDYRRVYISLYQTNVPKLVNAGIVSNGDGELGPGENHAAALAAIDSLDEHVAVEA